MNESLLGKMARHLLRLLSFKRWLQRAVAKGGGGFSGVPWFVRLFFRAEIRDFAHGRCIELIPRRGERSEQRLVYFHGGAFALGILVFHWDMIVRLGLRTRCRIVVGLYPRTPQFDHTDIQNFAERLYLDQFAEVGAENLSLLGDSAGATLALSLVRQLQQKNLPLPRSLYLLSPWLDLSLSSPEAEALERDDVVLDVATLKCCGLWYAKGKSPRDPEISPYFAEFSGLPPTWLFACTGELFLPDLRAFAQRYPGVHYHEYPGLYHGWVATRLPESRAVIEIIASTLD